MAHCTTLGLHTALQIWASGEKLDGYCLYGVSAVAIGRAAKVITFLSAIPILIDIIGERRISLTQISISRWLDARQGKLGSVLTLSSRLMRWLFPNTILTYWFKPRLYMIIPPFISALLTLFLYHLWLVTVAVVWKIVLYIPITLAINFVVISFFYNSVRPKRHDRHETDHAPLCRNVSAVR
jgi:hypothetical protein